MIIATFSDIYNHLTLDLVELSKMENMHINALFNSSSCKKLKQVGRGVDIFCIRGLST